MQFLANLDLNKNQLQNAVAHFLAAAPASPSEGQLYYNSASKFLGLYNGTGWVIIGRLDQMAAGADVSLSGFKMTSLGSPTAPADAATKAYVDGVAQGMAWKDEVRAATAAAGTLATSFASGQVVDGVTLVTGDRVLVKNQAAGAENGIYVVNAAGAPTRAPDADSDAELRSATVLVQQGTANGDTAWLLTNDGAITPGTTALAFVKVFGGTTGGGLNKFSVAVGDGVATSIAVTHNLGSQDVQVYVYRAAAPFDRVFPDVQHSSASVVTLVFATAPSAGQFRAVVVG